MVRVSTIGLAMALATALLAQAALHAEPGAKRKSGAIILYDYERGKKPDALKGKTKSRGGHSDLGSWSKAEGLDVTWDTPSASGKSKNAKRPKAKTLCATPDGKRRAC